MKQVNMILQGKGGVGKSLVASLLAQHYQARGITPLCIDTDPVNDTFTRYKGLNVKRLELMSEDNDVDHRAFDGLIEMIVGAEDNAKVVVDNGAATFVPLCSYMVENDIVGFLREQGIDLTIHTVLTGGQALDDTLIGLSNLFGAFEGVPICIWSNEFWGRPQRNGKALETMKVIADNSSRIQALIRIPKVREETYGKDMDQMLREKQTFAEVAANSAFTIMARQRLKTVWKEIDAQISGAHV